MKIFDAMRIWLALLVAPSLALAAQSIMYSLVTPSCSIQTRVTIHAVGLLTVALAALFTVLARAEWSRLAATSPQGPDNDTAAPQNVRRFLAVVATAVGGLSTLVILTMWFAGWVLSPCAQ
jgi:heme/copper-type cytochrome/quinol oxidase subunit 3